MSMRDRNDHLLTHSLKRLESMSIRVFHIGNKWIKRVAESALAYEFQCSTPHPDQDVDFSRGPVNLIMYRAFELGEAISL